MINTRNTVAWGSSVKDRTSFEVPPSVSAPLLRVDLQMRAATTSDNGRLSAIAHHLIDAGGKRLRPTLALSCALAVGGCEVISPRVVDAAVAVELAHMASLYHDDVLDGAALRRGRPSANALWGNECAVLGGDVLLAHAYRVASELGARELRCFSRTVVELCAGQVAEADQQHDHHRAVADYEFAIRGKTASLLSTSCWLGAVAAGATDATADALAGYGLELGMAFQVVDDLLDLCGDSRDLGKPTGADLRAGVFTLPVLLALDKDPAIAHLLIPDIDERGIEEVRRRVRAAGADRRAGRYALAHLVAARAHLSVTDLDPAGGSVLVALAKSVAGPLVSWRLDEADASPVRPRSRPADATRNTRGDPARSA